MSHSYIAPAKREVKNIVALAICLTAVQAVPAGAEAVGIFFIPLIPYRFMYSGLCPEQL